MPLTVSVEVPPRDRDVLASWRRSPWIRAGLAQRATIVPLAADGTGRTRSPAGPGCPGRAGRRAGTLLHVPIKRSLIKYHPHTRGFMSFQRTRKSRTRAGSSVPRESAGKFITASPRDNPSAALLRNGSMRHSAELTGRPCSPICHIGPAASYHVVMAPSGLIPGRRLIVRSTAGATARGRTLAPAPTCRSRTGAARSRQGKGSERG